MSTLVTGGKGFIGSRVIHKLVALGEDVVCLEPKTTGGRLTDIKDRIKIVAGDVANIDTVLNSIQDHEVTRIAHMVYLPTSHLPGEMHREISTMVQGTANVFEAARRMNIQRVILPSSIAYYGPQWLHGEKPLREDAPSLAQSLYGVSKRLCEVLGQNYNCAFNMEITALRVSVVYGNGGWVGGRGVNLIATETAVRRPVVLPYPPDARVLICHVEDVAEVVVRLLISSRVEHQVYNIGGNTFSYGQLADIATDLIPEAELAFNMEGRIDLPYLVNWDRLKNEFGPIHREPRAAYRELIDQTRHERGLPHLP